MRSVSEANFRAAGLVELGRCFRAVLWICDGLSSEGDLRAMGMKQAKASDEDLLTLIRFFEALEDSEKKTVPALGYRVRDFIPLVSPCWRRVVYGYDVMFRNACDPNLPHLDYRPDIKHREEHFQPLLDELQEILTQLSDALVECKSEHLAAFKAMSGISELIAKHQMPPELAPVPDDDDEDEPEEVGRDASVIPIIRAKEKDER